jgi:hypothetical protein
MICGRRLGGACVDVEAWYPQPKTADSPLISSGRPKLAFTIGQTAIALWDHPSTAALLFRLATQDCDAAGAVLSLNLTLRCT